MRYGPGCLIRTALVVAAIACGMAPAWATSPNVSQAAPKMLNPQPEVPSKQLPGDAKGPTQAPVLSPRPDETSNPKALNPQPEVPSKPYKKTMKKKPGSPAPGQ